jgi:hypothetical protein
MIAEARIRMIVVTTSSSMKVKPRLDTLDYLTVTVTGLTCNAIGAPSGVVAMPVT